MNTPTNCPDNADTLQLVRDGSSQDQRYPNALAPSYAPVDQRKIEHALVFAKAYARYLQFYGDNGQVVGNWQAFFSQDVSAQLAVAAVQDVDFYKTSIKAYVDYLNNLQHSDETALKNNLGYLFSSVATLAKQLDALKVSLPVGSSLQNSLQDLIKTQLAPAFKRLLMYYRDGVNAPPPFTAYLNDVTATFSVMGAALSFKELLAQGMSNDWIVSDKAGNWPAYVNNINDLNSYPLTDVYGSGSNLFQRLNHIATHNLFTSVLQQFLKAYARVVNEAKHALEDTFHNWDSHEPHTALFLAFLKLFDTVRAETNTLTQKHLDFYYRDILKLKAKPAIPSHAYLLLQLAKQVEAYDLAAGLLFKAGKDGTGHEVFFANDRDFVANQAKVTALQSVYRHGNEPQNSPNLGRIYASPVANSDDGLGAVLTATDQSWQPFFNKVYKDGQLNEINMPEAEIGFAIASHYLWLAEGARTITVDFTVPAVAERLNVNRNEDLICQLSTEKGWFDITPTIFMNVSGILRLQCVLPGAAPAIIPYVAKIHGYSFATDLPVLLVKLKHRSEPFIYADLQNLQLSAIDVTVTVDGLKTLAVSNDFGPIDTSKPFQPFAATPIEGSSFIIGANEVFHKNCSAIRLNSHWQIKAARYDKLTNTYTGLSATTSFLLDGNWSTPVQNDAFLNTDGIVELTQFKDSLVEQADFSQTGLFQTSSRNGYLRIALTASLGQAEYLTALRDYLIDQTKLEPTKPNPGTGPQTPTLSAISIGYTANQTIAFNAAGLGRFFHLSPFGQAEQPTSPNTGQAVFLLPQFSVQADNANQDSGEFYIGISGLQPPQNLALLCQIADGTANPLSEKPVPHIQWSYLQDNQWLLFAKTAVVDQTDGLINSGIISFAVPRTANNNNSLMPAGMHWLRATASSHTDAVCRLRLVAAQALAVTFTDKSNDPAFLGQTLAAGTVSQLESADAAIKQISQPFPGFGGRGVEQPQAFYTRVSERLRHKDRAISLWDFEHLILEAFPQIYKVLCLNHTYYEPTTDGMGSYQELAPGHVTVVTIPNQLAHNLVDPLRPYTSLGMLAEIKAYLQNHSSCFAELHVKNPRFEQIRVQFKVKFYPGFDESFYTVALQNAISRFLSPWAFDNSARPSFAGKVYKSVLINFVEEQPYVDYVTDFKLFHDLDKVPAIDQNEVQGATAVSILVSAPADQHLITALNPTEDSTSGATCGCESV